MTHGIEREKVDLRTRPGRRRRNAVTATEGPVPHLVHENPGVGIRSDLRDLAAGASVAIFPCSWHTLIVES